MKVANPSAVILINTFYIVGTGNDAIKCMKDHYGAAMQDFLDDNRHFPGGTPGDGDFMGKELRKIMEPDSLRKLSEYLPSTGDAWLRYLSAVRDLYGCCVKQHLDEDFSYEDKVDRFRSAFEEVHVVFGLSETLKV